MNRDMRRKGWLKGLVIGLSTAGLVAQAEAITTKVPVSVASSDTNSAITFILGEDGAIWYTVTNRTGAAGKTGNASNVFDLSSFSANGFVSKTSLTNNCSSDTCLGIWARTPGAGSFQDAPQAIVGGGGNPISGKTTVITILAAGQDKNVWYTIMDTNSGNTSNIGGASGTTIPTNDPFSASNETGDTGFVSQSSSAATGLGFNCGAQNRTCVGIWAAFP
jgi:hypothetical protein